MFLINRLTLIGVMVSAAAFAQIGDAGCSSDADCKGSRTCGSDARCVSARTTGGREELRQLVSLHTRIETMELTRPSLGWPLIFTSLGGAGELYALLSLIGTGASLFLPVLSIVVAVVSSVPLIIGSIVLGRTVIENERRDRELMRLRLRSPFAFQPSTRMLQVAQF